MGGKGRASKGYVAAPSGGAAGAQYRKTKSNNSSGICTGITIVLLIVVGVYLFAFNGLEQLQDLINGDDDNVAFNFSDQSFDEIVGRDGDYIQLGFLQDLGNNSEVADAFFDAAARWSDIVAGSVYPRSGGFQRAAGEPFCTGVDEGFVRDITINTLVIVVAFASLEPAGVLGRAGPCFIQGSPTRALTGQMTFDIEELPGLLANNNFGSVVLHEMGHVLGIGPLWDNNNLLFNEVFGQNSINLNNQPEYRGAQGLAAYRNLLNDQGEQFVPVEDGVFGGVEQFNRAQGAGQGSIDGHWDKDFFLGELMEFQIAEGANPPLSIVSIASLADQGYVVNTGLADAYTPPSQSLFKRFSSSLRGSKRYITLEGDIDLSAMIEVFD